MVLGIGLGIAKGLAQAGCKSITINGFIPPDSTLPSITQQIKSYNNNVQIEYHPADISQPKQIEDLIDSTVSKFGGGVDILINNAGVQYVSPVEEFPVDQWEKIIAINLSAVFHATKRVIPVMKKQGWGMYYY